MSQNVRRVYLLVAVVFAWIVLALQFHIVVDRFQVEGSPLVEAVIRFASYFTVTTNTLVAVLLTLSLIRSPERAPRPPAIAAATVYIIIVGIIYYLLLAKSWNPQGIQLVANVGLHYVMPAVMVIYWLLFVPKGETRWSHAVWWLIYPLVYFAFTLAEGLRINWYPYPFVDVATLGYMKVAINGAALLIFFYVLNLIMIALDKTLGRAAIRQTA
jgi:hypothetical protein